MTHNDYRFETLSALNAQNPQNIGVLDWELATLATLSWT